MIKITVFGRVLFSTLRSVFMV